ncbi:MAG: hypothetical protein LBD12_04205, partial [Clostridiales Family XIII bacterium]|nr:hypothetical protein [Clostridiales Family XIII bacterium]
MEKTQNPESGAGYLERTYQRSLCLLYLKAVRDVLGESVEVTIFNSLSRGLYTEIETERPPTDVQLRRIEARMRSYVEADAPITRKEFGRMALLGYLRQGGGASPERIALLENAPDLHYVAVCELDGYENIFYGPLFPSAGPLRLFELLRYMDGVMLRYPHPSDPSRLPDMLEDYKLYSAFREGWTIAELCGLRFVGDLNREIEAGNAQEVIALSERLHRAKTGLIAKRVVARKRRVVLIAGPSSSGKTTFAKRLAARLGELGQAPLYLGTDDYFLERAQSPVGRAGVATWETSENREEVVWPKPPPVSQSRLPARDLP